jgi:hypothetical protein
MRTSRWLPAGAIVAATGLFALTGIPYGWSQATKPVPGKLVARSPLDRALRLINEARQNFAQVEDYTCTLVKREMIGERMLPENVILMKVRNEPFSVYMKWQQPKALVGQEACYVAGKNNGMMRVKGAGLLGAVGFVNLDPSDPRSKQNSRHKISEAGIGNMIERFAESWQSDRSQKGTKVRIGEYEFNKVRCVRVETTHPGSKPGDFYCYRSVLYFDKESHLPIRSELYDWPKEGGKPDGDLMECFSFTDLKLNVGLTDDVFEH